MNAKRKTIHVACALIVLSALCILITRNIPILNNTFIGILGSTIVSLFLLIPEFYEKAKTNKNSILYTAINIENEMKQIEDIIEKKLLKNDILTENLFELFTNQLVMYLNNLSNIEFDNYIFFKTKNNYNQNNFEEFMKMIPEIKFEYEQNCRKFKLDFGMKKLEKMKEKNLPYSNVYVIDMKDELEKILELSKNRRMKFEKNIESFLNNAQKEKFADNQKFIDEFLSEYKEKVEYK